MENDEPESIRLLNEDTLTILAKDYIRERDGLSFSLSGFDSFAKVYGRNRKSLSIKRSYFLSSLSPSSPWDWFFRQHIKPSKITSFDGSKCYWIPAEEICHYIHQMPNLEVLDVQDTKICLGNLPNIFKSCKKLTKLSFTLSERNVSKFQEGVMEEGAMDLIKKGFGLLSHLKIYAFAPDGISYGDFWLVILGVLKWCRDCYDLFIEVANVECPRRSDDDQEFDRVMEIGTGLFPQLVWMSNLRSFIIRRYDDSPDSYVVGELCNWLNNTHFGFPNLERLWITQHYEAMVHAFEDADMAGASVKAIAFKDDWDKDDLQLTGMPFRQLEHLSGIGFSPLRHLPDLKSFRGFCTGDEKEIQEFCKAHPKLEELRVRSIWDRKGNIEEAEWELLSLKILVYWFMSFKLPHILNRLLQASPNIEELHLKNIDMFSPRNRMQTIEFYSSIRFNHLIVLDIFEINLFDGSYLPMIAQQCPKLERILLEGDVIESSLFLNLAECLPSASNLVDLRVKWNKNGRMDAAHLQRFGDALVQCSSHLERLVLINEKDMMKDKKDRHKMVLLPDFLLPFVIKMKHLVGLCLVGFQMKRSDMQELKRRFTDEIVPTRSAFWYYLDPQLPEGNDPSIVPRVHYDEIVCPEDAFDVPPRF